MTETAIYEDREDTDKSTPGLSGEVLATVKSDAQKAKRGVSPQVCARTLRCLMSGEKTVKQVADAVMVTTSTIYLTMDYLLELGAVSASGSKPKLYRFVKMPDQYRDVPAGIIRKTPKGPENNPLTKALSVKKPKVEMDSIEVYQACINDMRHTYGIGELDDITSAIIELCRSRIAAATTDCPVCGSRLLRAGSGASCLNCGISIDLGESRKSLEAFTQFVKQMKEVKG